MNILPDSINNALKNTTDEPTKAMGRSFRNIWQLVFGYWLEEASQKKEMKMQQNLKEYEKELVAEIHKVPEHRRIEPSLLITGQALQKSQFSIEEESLRKMFAKLIAKSMDAEYSSSIHPGFAETIAQMSPDDAMFLKYVSTERTIAVCQVLEADAESENKFNSLTPFFHISLMNNWEIDDSASCISSLCRLGILEIKTDRMVCDEQAYACFDELTFYRKGEVLHYNSDKVGTETNEIDHRMARGLAELTAFGLMLINICLGD